MLNARISQIGQTAVNRPFFEVHYNGRRYAAFVNRTNQVEFVRPKTLCEMGISSMYANQFQTELNPEIIAAMKITGTVTAFDKRFPHVTLGTGLGFVDNFLPYKGWKLLYSEDYLLVPVTGPVMITQ